MPAVSVVLPTLNEQGYLRDCLDSLLAQDYTEPLEILVVDGGSTDDTRAIAAAVGARVIDNPRVTAAAAMNIGIEAASNDLIVRADAHTIYAPDYVSSSVRALTESGADWVGGRMNPVGTTCFGRAVAAVTASPFGVGPGRFHYSDVAEDVETVYLGAFDRSVVRDVGGYDETDIQWAAEDQELAFRLRRAGRRIRLVPSIVSWYFPRETPGALWRQYHNYGMCKASTLAKHHTLPYWRPLAPAALVVGLLLHPAVGAGYAAATAAIAARLRQPGVTAGRALVALWVCHLAYGVGFWRGIWRIVSGRGFDSRRESGSGGRAR